MTGGCCQAAMDSGMLAMLSVPGKGLCPGLFSASGTSIGSGMAVP